MNANNEDRELAVVADIKDVSLTLKQVAIKHGISYSTVAKLTKKHNLSSLREPGRPWGSKKVADVFTKPPKPSATQVQEAGLNHCWTGRAPVDS